jgi:hypothetical protein
MKVDAHRASARRVVDQLLASLRASDEVALLTFDKGLSVEQDFTSDWARIREALDEVEPFGSTSLYDAIAETAGQLERERTGRRAIVVVTDGLDNASRMQPADVSGIASRSDVPVYVLAVVSALDVPGTNAGTVGSQATGQLKNLAWWTGGDAFVVSSPAQMSVASRAVLSELRHQYVLAIESAGDAGWRPLDIKTRRRGCRCGRAAISRCRDGSDKRWSIRTAGAVADRGRLVMRKVLVVGAVARAGSIACALTGPTGRRSERQGHDHGAAGRGHAGACDERDPHGEVDAKTTAGQRAEARRSVEEARAAADRDGRVTDMDKANKDSSTRSC